MQTKKIIRAICCLLIFVLSLSLFTACGSKDANVGTDETDNTVNDKDNGNSGEQEDEVSDTGPKTEISIAWWVSGAVDDSTIIEEELEKHFTDIDFVPWYFERDTYADQFNTKVAGGDIPDVFLSPYNNYAMISQEIAAGFDIDLLRESAPNYYSAVLKYNDEFGCQTFAVPYYEGKFYGWPLLEYSQVHPFADGWRKDWLENVGITEIPETLEEYEVAFRKFRDEDPTNGATQDVYAFTGKGKNFSSYMWHSFFMAHGTTPMGWDVIKDGQLVDASTTEEYKETLMLLNRWYKEGFIDPEFITTDDAVLNEKIANNKVGYIPDATWYRIIEGGQYGNESEYYDLVKQIPGGELVLAKAPKGPDGNQGYMGWGPTPGNMIMFGKHLEEDTDKLKKVMSTLDEILSNDDLYLTALYGVEGEHWNRDEQTGIPVFTESAETEEGKKQLGVNFWANIAFVQFPEMARKHRERQDIDREWLNSIISVCTVDYRQSAGITFPPISKEEEREMADINAAVGPLKQKWFFDFVTGDKSFDEWDTWIEEWKAAGGERLMEKKNENFNKVNSVIEEVNALIK